MELVHPMNLTGAQIGCVCKAVVRHQCRRIHAQNVLSRDTKQCLEVGRLAVQRASRLCRAAQSKLKQKEEMGKADQSPVTVADFGSQAIVAYTLQHSFGSISMVAEEDASAISGSKHATMRKRITELVNQFLPDEEAHLTESDVMDLLTLGRSEGGDKGDHWVLDPIDGTIGFVSNRQYAICLGRIVDGTAVMGLLGCPNLPKRRLVTSDGQSVESAKLQNQSDDVGCLFVGTRGGDAHLGSLWSDIEPDQIISVDTETPLNQIRFMESYESKHSNHELARNLAEQLGIQSTPLRLDSQAKYGALSRGDAGLFMRFPPGDYREKIWDHCAGSVVVEAAGGCVSDALGDPLDFSQGRYLNIHKGIVAAAPELHSKLTNLFQES